MTDMTHKGRLQIHSQKAKSVGEMIRKVLTINEGSIETSIFGTNDT